MVHAHRLRMREVPVRMYARGGGVSSITGSGKSAYYMIKVLLAMLRRPGAPAPCRRARRRGAPWRREHGI